MEEHHRQDRDASKAVERSKMTVHALASPGAPSGPE
jgi:hypothetical protein